MKKKRTLWCGILLISALSVIAFSSCDKDTWCYLEVSVIDQATKSPLPAAHVRINMDGSIDDRGITDEAGVYSTKFAAPAIFNVSARTLYVDTLNPSVPFFRKGIKSVRLKEGETVQVTVEIEDQMYRGEIDNWDLPY